MSVTDLLARWEFLLDWLHILLPVTLGILAVIQLLYYGYLNSSLGRRRPRQPRNLPDSPVMPTDPATSVNVNYVARQQQQTAPDLNYDTGNQVAKMVILNGLPNVSEIKLPSSDFGIGRFYMPDKDVLVALDERSISRRHAFFHGDTNAQEYFLMDTSSSYGTSIRRGEVFQPLTPGQEERIYNGDVVQFGTAVTVRFVLPGDTRSFATQG
jgi:pSer/pThr/pTyr-binding forkhead associated (FHA) protein